MSVGAPLKTLDNLYAQERTIRIAWKEVLNELEALPPPADIIIIHDCVRDILKKQKFKACPKEYLAYKLAYYKYQEENKQLKELSMYVATKIVNTFFIKVSATIPIENLRWMC